MPQLKEAASFLLKSDAAMRKFRLHVFRSFDISAETSDVRFFDELS